MSNLPHFSTCKTLREAEAHFIDSDYYGDTMHGYLDQMRDTFARYIRPGDVVAEFGVHKCRSTVFLLQLCSRLHSWEIGQRRKERHDDVMSISQGRWTLTYGDSRKAKLPEVDSLFIDSDHVYECMRDELANAAPRVRRYIILHDTTTHWWRGHNGEGIGGAVREFLAQGGWRMVERCWPAPGIMVLGRV